MTREIISRTCGSDVVKRYFLSRALAVPLFGRAKPIVQLVKRASGETLLCEIMNLEHWVERKCLKLFISSSGGPFVW